VRMLTSPDNLDVFILIYSIWNLAISNLLALKKNSTFFAIDVLGDESSYVFGRWWSSGRGSSRTIWRKKSLRTRILITTQNNLTSINSEIDRHNNGNVLIARELLDTLPAKICWGILTSWQRGIPFWMAYPCDVSKFSIHFGPQVYTRYEL
jgi:hypothetical protein